jgi:hypothetical protein
VNATDAGGALAGFVTYPRVVLVVLLAGAIWSALRYARARREGRPWLPLVEYVQFFVTPAAIVTSYVYRIEASAFIVTVWGYVLDVGTWYLFELSWGRRIFLTGIFALFLFELLYVYGYKFMHRVVWRRVFPDLRLIRDATRPPVLVGRIYKITPPPKAAPAAPPEPAPAPAPPAPVLEPRPRKARSWWPFRRGPAPAPEADDALAALHDLHADEAPAVPAHVTLVPSAPAAPEERPSVDEPPPAPPRPGLWEITFVPHGSGRWDWIWRRSKILVEHEPIELSMRERGIMGRAIERDPKNPRSWLLRDENLVTYSVSKASLDRAIGSLLQANQAAVTAGVDGNPHILAHNRAHQAKKRPLGKLGDSKNGKA